MRWFPATPETQRMGLLKEKCAYRPTALEQALAWIVTLASAAAVLWFVVRGER
jgi:hypothetical protein